MILTSNNKVDESRHFEEQRKQLIVPYRVVDVEFRQRRHQIYQILRSNYHSRSALATEIPQILLLEDLCLVLLRRAESACQHIGSALQGLAQVGSIGYVQDALVQLDRLFMDAEEIDFNFFGLVFGEEAAPVCR